MANNNANNNGFFSANSNANTYFYESVPAEDRLDADPEAKRIAQEVIDKYEEVKALGADLQNIADKEVLVEERAKVDEYNVNHRDGQQIEIHANKEHNTLMGVFITSGGDVADEVVTSPTPAGITNITEYNESFSRIFGRAHNDNIDASSSGEESFSTPSEASSNKDEKSNKRTRDDDSDDDNAGESSKRQRTDQDYNTDTISSIYDLAGDD